MAKEGTIIWKGKSGNEYRYDIYPINTQFNNVPANYVFMKKLENGNYTCIYFGITKDLSERFDNHHAMPCIKKNGATHVGIHQNSKETDREKQESDLLASYNTVCNIQNN